MTDILEKLRAAFDGDSVPEKNLALRKAHDEIERLRNLHPAWTCIARKANTGANDPAECVWPVCGCDPYAEKVIAALEEMQG